MRLFIAIGLNDTLKEKISELQKYFIDIDSDVKWVDRKNLHFTLKFLGETGENKLKDIESAINKSLVQIKSFFITIEKTGTFPETGAPRVLWLGISEGSEILSSISSKLNDYLFESGFEKENRGFTPHLTIGRVRSNRNILMLKDKIKQFHDISIGKNEVNEVLLMQSKLTPSGPIYTRAGVFKI